MKFRLIEDFEDDDFITKEQEITSKDTANGNGGGEGKLPALFNKIPKVEPGKFVFDYGCGKYTTSEKVKEFLGDGVDYAGYDKYNRTSKENSDAIRTVRANGGADIVTCANVLNVIQSRDVRVNEVISNIYRCLKNGGVAYFDVYSKSGEIPRQTGKDSWQEFRKIATYMDEVEEIFGEGNVTRKGGILIAHK